MSSSAMPRPAYRRAMALTRPVWRRISWSRSACAAVAGLALTGDCCIVVPSLLLRERLLPPSLPVSLGCAEKRKVKRRRGRINHLVLLLELREGGAEQPRDVHLGDAHAACDVSLGEAQAEAKVDQLPAAVVEPVEPGTQLESCLRNSDLVRRGAELVPGHLLGRHRPHRHPASARVVDRLLVEAEVRGDLRDGGAAAVRARELLDGVVNRS